MGMQPFAFAHVILPIGISFYTFESISYITDVYRGDVEATEHPVDFATFIALFPHLIAGPVFRYKDLAGQFEKREHSVTQFGQGALRFLQGFIKKGLIERKSVGEGKSVVVSVEFGGGRFIKK